MKQSIIKNISPLNNNLNMSKPEYIIKKVLAFILIFGCSALIGEGIIIGSLYGMGYDPLNGVMPTGQIAELLPYYGYIIFIVVTLLYCKLIEKKDFKSFGISFDLVGGLSGIVLAVILLFAIIVISLSFNAITFSGINSNINISSLILWGIAFMIQGTTEEIMCRGFLLNSLRNKISLPMTIFISSTAFAFPHLLSLFEAEFVYVIPGILNLYLISIIFSLITLWHSNVCSACGLHVVWNFVLYTIMGLSLSGSENVSSGLILFNIKNPNILNGAEYGVEASLITTVVLSVVLFVMIKIMKGRISKDGVQ